MLLIIAHSKPAIMSRKLIIRKTKNPFVKHRRYKITINQLEQIYVLDAEKEQIVIDLHRPENIVEISTKDEIKNLPISYSDQSTTLLTIYPNLTYELVVGIFLGFALVALVVNILLAVYDIQNILYVLLPLAPLLFLKKRNFKDRFDLRTVKQ